MGLWCNRKCKQYVYDLLGGCMSFGYFEPWYDDQDFIDMVSEKYEKHEYIGLPVLLDIMKEVFNKKTILEGEGFRGKRHYGRAIKILERRLGINNGTNG